MQIDQTELCPFHCRCKEAAAEIERLTRELADAQLDYFRRHKDACDFMEENIALKAENERQRVALQAIAGFGSVSLAGEYESGLRDIIRSMTDCAKRTLEQRMAGGK